MSQSTPHPQTQRPTLYVVATPIGNLADLSLRARSVLEQVDRIAAEDTRNTARLLDALGIKKPLLAHHAHNEAQSAQGLLAIMQAGESIALVSDAGTPAVSDPGAELVRVVAQAGFDVVPLPGASSVLAVVAASGLVQGPFTFRGFLPAKGAARLRVLSDWLAAPEPQVIFEAPHRIEQLAQDLVQVCSADRLLCAGREMTKQFETFYRGTARELAHCIAQDEYATKGEWALVVGPTPQAQTDEDDEQTDPVVEVKLVNLAQTLLQYTSPKTVVQSLMQLSGLPKRVVYPLVMAQKEQADES